MYAPVVETRRDFLKSAAALTGSAFLWGTVPEAVARAMEIDPEENSTYLDAEHIVILMQENRSFDHSYGALKGVRGFRDKRLHVQPNGRPVWFQSDAEGHTYAPFRLNMKESNVTWIGGLPHSWGDQVDARNGGLYDKWLIAKPRKEFPFTLGHYTREDLPFYYALADAFTVCDQAFCSSLTGTTPNRLYLWTGTIRADKLDTARVTNGDTDYDAEASWKTFPERLQEANVTWKTYQNEISLDTGLHGEHDAWLSNFTDNPLEWMSQHKVRFHNSRREYVKKQIEELPGKIAELEKSIPSADPDDKTKAEKKLADGRNYLEALKKESVEYSDAAWDMLPNDQKELHLRAFASNHHDPDHRELVPLTYQEGSETRTINVPKSDVLSNFRKDVDGGTLPAVSWIVAPEAFSDHPGSAWFGAWYLSEVMNILTKNPKVWQKTIFVLCYDENDGYFDHVPPFVAPHPGRPETGNTSKSIDTTADVSNAHGRDHSIGLGFRCPMVVASPWSRGGCVNSQVFDHTSIIQLVETWLEGKSKKVVESNISNWRRAVCGDMSSVFRPYDNKKTSLPEFLKRDTTIEAIYNAKFQKPPVKIDALSEVDMKLELVGILQERGTKPSCPLPYELSVNATQSGNNVKVDFAALKGQFGANTAGSGFNLYVYGDKMMCRAYAVAPGESTSDSFEFDGDYHIRVDGPNGFTRTFKGSTRLPGLRVEFAGKGREALISIKNEGKAEVQVMIEDPTYHSTSKKFKLAAGETKRLGLQTQNNTGWYDFVISGGGSIHQFAGRLEDGKWSITDPAMGNI